MANTKERLIWSSDINEELGSDEDIKAEFEDYLNLNDSPIELLEDEGKMFEWASETVNIYLEDVKTEIEIYEGKHGEKDYLIIADIGRWNGRYEGGRVITGMVNVLNKIIEDYTKIYQEEKALKVSTANHDASSFFKIYELTTRGKEWYDNNNDLSWRDICEHLAEIKSYHKNVTIFNEIYGW